MPIEWPHQRENAKELRRKLLRACDRLGIPVRLVQVVDGNPALAGMAHSGRTGVEVCSELEEIEQTAALVHELTHECLHYDAQGKDCGFSSEFEEREARGVERAVLEHFGVVCGSTRLTPRMKAARDRLVSEVEHSEYEDVSATLQEFTAALGGSV